MTTFAQRLVVARESMEISQSGLGRAINAAQSTVATWETGKNEPDLATIKRIGKVLNRAPEWLAFGSGGDFGANMVPVDELDVRAMSGPGGLIDANEGDEQRVRARYIFPAESFRSQFGIGPDKVKILEVIGDSNVPTLNPGERVVVNPADRIPSPPGLFVVWDGIALVLKRIEYIAHSDPPRVRISSDNPRYQPYERTLEEAYIQGRVIGSWQRR